MDVYLEAQEWLRLDRNTVTRAEISGLLAEDNVDELKRRLHPRISFGTAGLRARDEAGFARINTLTVIQTTQGLAAHIIASNPQRTCFKALIGYDGRHKSKKFAELAAASFLAKGFVVELYESEVHTPLVAFGVRLQRADVGVMVTASHNPPGDNGYKVYGHNGTQINAPEDTAIASAILSNLEPLVWELDRKQLQPDPLISVCNSYYDHLSRIVELPLLDLPVVYTPLHVLSAHPSSFSIADPIF